MDENKKVSELISDQEAEMNKILGYGEKLKVFLGKEKDETTGEEKEKFITYHFCPVSLSDIPALVKALNIFGKVANDKSWSPESLKSIAIIIQLSLKKAHGEIEIETLLGQFDFGSLAKAIRIAINLNDFLSETQTIKGIFNQLEVTAK